MEGTLHQTNYGWIVRYVKSNNDIIHYSVHPEDQKYLFDKDHGSEVVFDTEMYQDVNHRPTISESYSKVTARIIGAIDSYTRFTNPEIESLSERLDRIEKKSKQYDEMMEDLLDRVHMVKGITKIRDKESSEVDQIYKMLVESNEHGLEAEVVMFALMSMRRDPSQTLIQAMQSGMDEWIK